VSGKRNRYDDNKFDLDLTYITPRLIAMSFPASGLEAVYRNNIESVSKFLLERHSQHFRVYNMASRSYNKSKFNFQVLEFKWKDHHSPPLHLLFEACYSIYSFLKEDPKNVAVIHCNAGKGRTGTAIACVLLYCGLANNPKEAITYYGWKRFAHGKGVTQPSQIRYIQYFHKVYMGEVKVPMAKRILAISITNFPTSLLASNKPIFEICIGDDFDELYSGGLDSKGGSSHFDKNNRITMKVNSHIILIGDVYIRIKNKGKLGNNLICRFGFHTAFIPKDNLKCADLLQILC